jgi:hypothetical protein
MLFKSTQITWKLLVIFNLLLRQLGKVKVSSYTPWRRMGERRYNSYSYLTSELDGGKWSASRPSRALPPGKEPPVPIVQEAGWAPEPVWTQRLEEKSSVSVRYRTPVVQSVFRHYTDWATLTSCDSLYLTQFLLEKLTFYGRVLRSITCVALVHKAADEIRIKNFFKIIRSKENKWACSNW